MPQMFQQFFADIEEQTARLHKKASLEKLITEKPSPHEQHKKLFVFESLEQRTHLLETYEAKYL